MNILCLAKYRFNDDVTHQCMRVLRILCEVYYSTIHRVGEMDINIGPYFCSFPFIPFLLSVRLSFSQSLPLVWLVFGLWTPFIPTFRPFTGRLFVCILSDQSLTANPHKQRNTKKKHTWTIFLEHTLFMPISTETSKSNHSSSHKHFAQSGTRRVDRYPSKADLFCRLQRNRCLKLHGFRVTLPTPAWFYVSRKVCVSAKWQIGRSKNFRHASNLSCLAHNIY